MNKSSHFSWRPTTTFILLAGFFVILIAMVVAYVTTNFKPTVAVNLGSGAYKVWLADDDGERSQGLSGVSSLETNGGMLFDFQEDKHWGIWMKDMQIPLDIIWLDADKAVIHIEEDVDPSLGTDQIFHPKTPARYVLELRAGSVSKAGIKLDQIARFELEGEK